MATNPPHSPEFDKACVLAFDGGGVKGLSSLYILRAIMQTLNEKRRQEEKDAVKPCQVFDLICGTSTGGLIAIMLGRLEMTVDECITAYDNMCERIFGESGPKWKVQPKGRWWQLWKLGPDDVHIQAAFNHEVLEECVLEIVKDRTASCHTLEDAQKVLLHDTTVSSNCNVFVCATKKGHVDTTVRFRSYRPPAQEQFVQNVTIVQAARATSAATSFFVPIIINGLSYIDGGTGANNPSEQAWDEIKRLWMPDKDNIDETVSCFISIGCGLSGITGAHDSVYGFFTETLVNIATETEKTASKFRRDHSKLFREKKCFRFNTTHGIEEIGLEEFEKLDDIRNAVDEELRKEDVADAMQEVAKRLVNKANPVTIGSALIPTETVERFIHSLYFKEYKERQHSDLLKYPEYDTFSWIHNNRRGPHCTTLPSWLQDPTRVYWITGKAGSGKSTMMKRIVEDFPQTADGNVSCAAFFIYKPAQEPLQRTLAGTLRSLIYQILRQDKQHQLTRTILQKYYSKDLTKHGWIPEWSVRNLKQLLSRLLLVVQTHRKQICLFIDGLDELPPEDWIRSRELRQLVESLQQSPAAWLCLSSRPEVPVGSWVPRLCRLDLASWNWRDIYAFTKRQLKPCGIAEHVPKQIANGADGIFLWAKLVTQNVYQSLEYSRDRADIDSLLRELMQFRDLHELFQELLSKALRMRGQRLQYYMRVLRLQRCEYVEEPNIALLTMARISDKAPDHKAFDRACEETELQIVAQSCGLLAVRKPKAQSSKLADQTVLPVEVWITPRSALLQENRQPHTRVSEDLERRLIKIYQPVERVYRHWNASLEWMHRSVFDYIMESNHEDAFGPGEVQSDAGILTSLIQARIALLAYGPASPSRANDGAFPPSAMRQCRLIFEAMRTRSRITTGVNANGDLDALKRSFSVLHPQEFANHGLIHYGRPGGLVFLYRSALDLSAFWCGCVYYEFPEYVIAHWQDLMDASDLRWLLALLILQWCISLWGTRYRAMNAKLLQKLVAAIRAASVFSQSNTLMWVSCPKMNWSYDGRRLDVARSQITWKGSSSTDASESVSIGLLAVAWLYWCQELWRKLDYLRQSDKEEHTAILDATKSLADVLDSLQVSIDTADPGHLCRLPRETVVAMSAAGFLPNLLLHKEDDDDDKEDDDTKPTGKSIAGDPRFRIICWRSPNHVPATPDKDHVVWELPKTTAVSLFQRCRPNSQGMVTMELGVLLKDLELRDEIINAVWNDEREQLDAWEKSHVEECLQTPPYDHSNCGKLWHALEKQHIPKKPWLIESSVRGLSFNSHTQGGIRAHYSALMDSPERHDSEAYESDGWLTHQNHPQYKRTRRRGWSV